MTSARAQKHAVLEERDIDLSTTTSVITDHRIYLGEGVTELREVPVHKVNLDWQGEVFATDFADQCIAEWDRLLRARGLL